MKSTLRLSLIAFITVTLFSSFKKNEKVVLSPSNTIIVGTKGYPIGVRYLYKWLNKIYNTEAVSNKNFSIFREYSELRNDNDTAGKIVLSIGDNHFNKNKDVSDLSPYSFIIKKNGNLIVIKGTDDAATNLGISYFLDHYCGVRFYLPGDLFTTMGGEKIISLPSTINVEKSPFTENITSTGFSGTGDPNHPHDILQWDNYWAQMNGLMRSNWGSFQHTISGIFYDSTIMKNYPEIYPLIDGKRNFPKSADDQGFEPDFAEPHLVDASLYAAVKYFKANPGIDCMAFSVMDGGGYPKEGKMEKFLANYPQTLDGLVQGFSDANAKFLNNLAARLPAELVKNGINGSKKIAYIVYGQVKDIPNLKLSPSISPITVWHLSNALGDSLIFFQGILGKWAKVTSNIGNDDWAEGKGFIYPRIYTTIISNYLREITSRKLSFKYVHVEAYPNWALDGPKFYEMAKLYWNPNINTDSLRSQFCKDLFGAAATPMHNYFDTVESISTWLNNHTGTPTHMFNYIGQLALDDARMLMVKQARQFLDEAARMSGTTDEEKKRIDFFSKGFKIPEYFFEIYNSKTVDANKVNELKDYLKNTVAGNQMILNIAADKNFLTTMDALVDQIVKGKK